MKKHIHKILLIISLLFFHLTLNPTKISAAGCEEFTVSPTQGTTATVYTIQGTNCGSSAEAYLIQIYDAAGNLIQGQEVHANANGTITYIISGLPGPGVYEVILYYQFNLVNITQFTVTFNEAINCGSIVTQPNICEAGETPINCCPESCPPIKCGSNTPNVMCPPGSWVCGDFGNEYFEIIEYVECFDNGGIEGINTAIGCIPYADHNPFIIALFTWLASIAGGLVLLLIGYSGFLFITSSGEPKQLQRSREIFVSAIAGLIFLITSIIILRTIGINLLSLPGF